MTLMIVEFLPWFAFAGAAFLLGWVGVDILMAKLRTSGAAPTQTPAESGRGLVGKPERFAESRAGESAGWEAQAAREEESEEADEPADVEARDEAEGETTGTDIPEEEESPKIPTSHARDVAEPPEVSDNEDASDDAAETYEPAETEATTDDATPEEDEAVLADVVMVRRDPSVRVFDAVVAPSSRKVRSTEG